MYIHIFHSPSRARFKNNHVSPTELESVLQRHPAVRESMAFGVPDPAVMEVVAAMVVANEGEEVRK